MYAVILIQKSAKKKKVNIVLTSLKVNICSDHLYSSLPAFTLSILSQGDPSASL